GVSLTSHTSGDLLPGRRRGSPGGLFQTLSSTKEVHLGPAPYTSRLSESRDRGLKTCLLLLQKLLKGQTITKSLRKLGACQMQRTSAPGTSRTLGSCGSWPVAPAATSYSQSFPTTP